MSSGVVKNQAESTHLARLDRRDESERVLSLARHLRRPEDRRAMVLRYREGWELQGIANTLGVSRFAAAKIMSRLERLVQSREFLLTAVGEMPCRLRPVAECLYLAAMTLNQAAEATGLPLHRVRQHKLEIEGMAEAAIENTPSYRGRRNTYREPFLPDGWNQPGVEVQQ